ncbi:hypothetical protein DVW08_17000 [Clostridium botulinum]|nr:hypothetical protein [Clostridium botulinum]
MKRITVLALVLIFTMLFAGCSNNSAEFTAQSYVSENTEITAVNIDVRDRAIEVSLSTDNQVHIDYFESDKESYNILVSDDHVLTMTAANNKDWTDYIGGKSSAGARKISLQLPDSLLSALTLTTTNNDIQLSELSVQGDISLSTNGGNIVFDKLNAGNTINLTAKNGNIEGSIIGSYDDFTISCDIKKGDCNLPTDKQNGVKTLNVSNNNGDVDIEFVEN